MFQKFLNPKYPKELVCCVTLSEITLKNFNFVWLTEIKATRCEKLNNEHCVGILQSNFTLFPNSRGDKTQEEASVMFEQSFVVVKSTCSKYLLPFLCGTYFPPCVNDSIIPLCPYLCDHSQAGCMESFKKYGTTWSYNCIDSYHQLNKSKECLGISGVEKLGKTIGAIYCR